MAGTHKWTWYPAYSQCKLCELLWFPTADKKATAVYLTENCWKAK